MMQNLVFVIDFVLLFLVTYYLRRRYLRGSYTTTSAASPIMALGIFMLSVLPYLPADFMLFRPCLTLELLVIWLFIADSYLQSYLHKHFYVHNRHMPSRINIGTWVVSTAVLSLLWLKSFQAVAEIALLLALIAVGVWIEYMRTMLGDLRILARNPVGVKLNGSIFLITISTQCIVILLSTILQDWLPVPILMILIALGYIYYAICLILFIRYYLQFSLPQIVPEWSHANSLLHGALSISGLACIKALAMSRPVIIPTWLGAVSLFIFVESIALIRFVWNIKKKGFRAVVWKYDIAQWSRSFAYALFYAFTVAIERIQPPAWKPVTFTIIAYGQYVTFILLAIQTTLFFQTKYKPMMLKEPVACKEVKK